MGFSNNIDTPSDQLKALLHNVMKMNQCWKCMSLSEHFMRDNYSLKQKLSGDNLHY